MLIQELKFGILVYNSSNLSLHSESGGIYSYF